ncbi:MAG: helix-turn-helix domain-containing protein [Deltaproteobacteria bacterium]|nr:helix-turn-helix domain-containing protein [Deltaproteobacteria bacterium]
MGIADTIDRMVGAVGGKTQGDLGAALGISQASISDAKRKGKIPPEWVVKLSTERNMNPAWLLTGQGPMKIGEATDKESLTVQPSININEGVLMTELVLSSGMNYAEALWSNLKSFAEAVRERRKVDELMKEVQEMKGMMKMLLDKQATPEEEAKKRDSAGNA